MTLQYSTAAINAARDSAYLLNPVSGLFERTLLLEGARTNSALGSCSFADGTYWSGDTAHTITPASSIIAGQTAYRNIYSGVGQQSRAQNVGTFANGQTDVFWAILENDTTSPSPASTVHLWDQTFGGSCASATITWATLALSTAGTPAGSGLMSLGSGRYLLWIAFTGTASGKGAAGHVRQLVIQPQAVSTTTGCIIHHAQLETVAPSPSSPIVTVAAPVTRAADSLSFPFTLTPQAMTVYVKFIEQGTALGASAVRVFQIGTEVAAGMLSVNSDTRGAYSAQVRNATGFVTSPGATPAVAFGDQVELRAVLSAAGDWSLTQSQNGGAETAPLTASYGSMPAAFSAPTLWVGRAAGGNIGFNAFQAVKVQRGIMTMDQMRAF